MKRFTFNKQLIESSTPPKNTNCLWIDKIEGTNKLGFIKEYVNNKWEDIIKSDGNSKEALDVTIEMDLFTLDSYIDKETEDLLQTPEVLTKIFNGELNINTKLIGKDEGITIMDVPAYFTFKFILLDYTDSVYTHAVIMEFRAPVEFPGPAGVSTIYSYMFKVTVIAQIPENRIIVKDIIEAYTINSKGNAKSILIDYLDNGTDEEFVCYVPAPLLWVGPSSSMLIIKHLMKCWYDGPYIISKKNLYIETLLAAQPYDTNAGSRGTGIEALFLLRNNQVGRLVFNLFRPRSIEIIDGNVYYTFRCAEMQIYNSNT